MKFFPFGAVSLTVCMALMGVPGAVQAAKQPLSTSKQFRSAMQQAQLAARAGDESAYQAGLASAATLAMTPDEKYYLAALQYSRANSLNQRDKARKSLGEMLRSGSALVPDRPALNLQAALMAFEVSDNKEAMIRFIEAERNGLRDPVALLAYAELHARGKRPAEARALADRALAAAAASGQKPPESWYLRGVSLAASSKKPDELARWGRMLLSAYPTASNWRATLMNYGDAAALGKAARFDLHRLVRDRGALAGERDITEFAELAIDARGSAEARIAIDQGVRNAMVSGTGTAVKNRLASAAKAQAGEKALLAAGSSGSASIKARSDAGQVALAMGDFEKSIGLFRSALAAGATGAEADEINTRLGIALTRAGRKDEARAAFAAVTGPRAEIAKFWIVHLDTVA